MSLFDGQGLSEPAVAAIDAAIDAQRKARGKPGIAGMVSRSAVATAVDTSSQVVFYDTAAFEFARTWAAALPNGFAFEVNSDGTLMIYTVAHRLLLLGWPALQIVIATKGAGALFYAAPDSSGESSDLVVGLLPGNTTPADFGSTLRGIVAANFTLTIASDSVAADTIVGDTTYSGQQFLADLGGQFTLFGAQSYVVGSDAPVTCAAGGTATTTGAIYQAAPPAGAVSVVSPAPPVGETQAFPLTPGPITAPPPTVAV